MVGRVATGVAIGGAAIGAGIWAADANAERTKRITLERGDTNVWDDLGIPGAFPDVTGLFAAAAAGGAALLVGTGRISGARAMLAVPAAAALGAVTGFMVGRRVGEYQATHSSGWDAAVKRHDDQRAEKRQVQAEAREESSKDLLIKQFHETWGADDDEVAITFQDAAQVVMGGYDHNGDDVINLSSGQAMAADERVADDHGGWRGGAWGPVTDPDSQVETMLPYFSGADSAGNGDSRASVDEVALKLREAFDENGNDRLDFDEGAYGRPTGREIDDYKDFAG